MKKLNDLSASSFLKLLFAFLTAALFITAVILPDRAQMFDGMIRILKGTVKVATNVFDIGGYSGSFLGAALVCLACTALFFLPKAKANAGSVIGFLLTMGFCFWGVNIMNMWFGVLGVLAYCLVKRENPAKQVNTMLFSIALAPLYSDLLLRYPNAEAQGFSWFGLAFAVGVGLFVGFFLPAGLPHSPKIHKGFSIYSAAVPIGFMAFLLRAVLYSLPGNDIPAAPENLHTASTLLSNVFCISLFAICIVAAFLMGGSVKKYWELLKDSGHSVDFSQKYGNATFLMNVGVYGLFIVAYYNAIGAEFNAITFGCIFAMLASCCSGAHPGNVWPVMLGYALISCIFRAIVGADYALVINNQTIVIGLCFANCLAPVSGKYGWWAGTIAAMLHYCIVKFVPDLHGGFLLYNGGFTSGIVCIMLIPVLEHFFLTKEDRKLKKQQ